MQSNQQILKSKQSNRLTFIAVQNETNRQVDVIWVDYDGIFHFYKTTDPEEIVHVYTYVHHAFVFLDTINRDRMIVDGKTHHYATPINSQYYMFNNQSQRVIGAIRTPLRSLKTLAMNAIRDSLPNSEAANKLDLPESLKHELVLAINLKKMPMHQCTEYIQDE